MTRASATAQRSINSYVFYSALDLATVLHYRTVQNKSPAQRVLDSCGFSFRLVYSPQCISPVSLHPTRVPVSILHIDPTRPDPLISVTHDHVHLRLPPAAILPAPRSANRTHNMRAENAAPHIGSRRLSARLFPTTQSVVQRGSARAHLLPRRLQTRR